jgi:hypothetical protein
LLLGIYYAQWSSNPQSTLENVHADNDRISLGEHSDDLESTRPNSLRSGILPLSLRDLLVIRGERVEQMVNNIRYSMCQFLRSQIKYDILSCLVPLNSFTPDSSASFSASLSTGTSKHKIHAIS